MNTKFLVILFFVVSYFFVSCESENTLNGDNIVSDIDGNKYHTVTIGTQTWMLENLGVKRFRNGDPIPEVTAESAWMPVNGPKRCSYNNDENNASVYGYLYNWYAIEDSRNICPQGWHVPTEVEWQTLIDYLGGSGSSVLKILEKGETHWLFNDANVTNESGFTALPGGNRSFYGGFSGINSDAYFWTQTRATEGVYDNNSARVFSINTSSSSISNLYKMYGCSVRCIKD